MEPLKNPYVLLTRVDVDNINENETQVKPKKENSPKKILSWRNRRRQRHKFVDTPTGRKYICPHCPIFLDNLHQLKTHKAKVHGENLLECENCQKIFYDRANLQIHLKTHTVRPRPFSCHCGLSFYANSHLRSHVRTVHEKKSNWRNYKCNIPQTCYFCGLVTTKLNNHMRLHTQECPLKCPHCHLGFGFHNTRTYHVTKHHSAVPQPHKCPVCGQRFLGKGNMKRHLKIHKERVKGDKCPHCPKTFHTKEEVKLHVNHVHNKSRKTTCPQCGIPFSSTSVLHVHIRFVHNKERNHPCGFCGKRFSTQTGLLRHIRTHTGERELKLLPCKMSSCEQKFQSDHLRLLHLRSAHNLVEEHKCPHCPRVYDRRGSLRRHVHSLHEKREPRHRCNFCNARYVDRILLEAHIASRHTGERPHKCGRSGCNKAFHSKGGLREHTKVHRDQDSGLVFKCSIKQCGKILPNKKSLDNHERIHKRGRVFVCYFCSKVFKTWGRLLQHVTQVHTMERGVKCLKCGAEFLNESGLQAHVDLNHGGRVCPCYFCGRRVTRVKGVEIEHLMSHTGERRWSCGLCGKEYMSKAYTMVHVEGEHGRVAAKSEIRDLWAMD